MKLNKNLLKNTNFGLTVVLLIGILLVANFLSYQIFYRFDVTQNKIFSISKVSKDTVGKLEDVVTIKAYFSDNLPNQYIGLRQEVGDILDAYRSYSNGKIRVEFISPGTDANTQQELALLGIPLITFQVYERDQMQVVNGYMGLTVNYGDNKE